MSDLDLSKYEWAENGCALGVIQSRCPRCRVKRDALLLLDEVRRLREQVDRLGLEYGAADLECETLREQVRRLRQSHARLLAVAKQVDNWMVPRCICRPEAKCLGCELRAAVAEAEKL